VDSHTRVFRGAHSEDFVILCNVLIWSMIATDKHTHAQTQMMIIVFIIKQSTDIDASMVLIRHATKSPHFIMQFYLVTNLPRQLSNFYRQTVTKQTTWLPALQTTTSGKFNSGISWHKLAQPAAKNSLSSATASNCVLRRNYSSIC